MPVKLRLILRRSVLVALVLLVVDWAIFFIWPLVSSTPFARQSMGEIRSSLRAHVALPAGDQDLPPGSGGDQYVIGIFGGSVAEALASTLPQYWSDIPEFAALSRAVGKPLRFADLALSSGREPVQYNLLHLYHDRIDLALFVDGFNELFQGILPSGRPGCEYVSPFWERNRMTPSELLQPLRDQQRDLERLADSWVWIPLRYSGLFKAYLYVHSVRSKQWALDYLRTMDVRPAVFTDGTDVEKVDAWANCITLSAAYAASVRLPIAFFLQPNQYVDGSKPFSQEERTCCLRSEPEMASGWERTFANVSSNYARMEGHIARLRAGGVAAFSLSRIYQDVAATIYIDNCCHVNLDGNRIMARAIAQQLLNAHIAVPAESPVRYTVPVAPPRDDLNLTL